MQSERRLSLLPGHAHSHIDSHSVSVRRARPSLSLLKPLVHFNASPAPTLAFLHSAEPAPPLSVSTSEQPLKRCVEAMENNYGMDLLRKPIRHNNRPALIIIIILFLLGKIWTDWIKDLTLNWSSSSSSRASQPRERERSHSTPTADKFCR